MLGSYTRVFTVIETNVYAWICEIKFALFFVRGIFVRDRKKDAK